MEHTRILPSGGASARFQPAALPPSVECLLAAHALRTLANAPITEVAVLLADLDRPQLAAAIDAMIAILDTTDGDPDVEENGDELDGTLAEDDFCEHSIASASAPGCPISDPGEYYGDEEDGNAVEDEFMWHGSSGPGCPIADPGGGNITDVCHDKDEDEDDSIYAPWSKALDISGKPYAYTG